MNETTFKADRLDEVIEMAAKLGEYTLVDKMDDKVIGIIEVKYYKPQEWIDSQKT